jgi:hypothetical protein
MTDFEERLDAALHVAATDAPPAVGLADAARTRWSRRRRTTALTSAAAVAAVVAVVGGVALLGSGGGGTADRVPVADGSSSAPTAEVSTGAPAQTESWRDLEITVPAGWGYGHLSTWCLNGKNAPGAPVVERPGGVVESIGCTGPENGYGVQFLDGSLADMAYQPGELWQYEPGGGDVYPTGAWLGYQRAGDNLVLVVAETRALTEQILSTFQHVTDVDANGCAPHEADQVPVVSDARPWLRLCRYDTGGWLEQSETLVGERAAEAISALSDAPTKGDRMCTDIATTVVLVSGVEREGRVALDSCQGLTWEGTDHDLTGDVLHWVLSPGWSGQVPEGITFEPRR